MRTSIRATLIVTAAVACGAFYYGYLFLRHPEGHGPVKIPMLEGVRGSDTNETWLVGIGDSVTAGFGASPGSSYWDRLINGEKDSPETQGKSLKHLFPRLIVTNLSQSGSTSLQHEKHQLNRVPQDGLRKAIVLMTTGGNDLIHSYGKAPPREEAMYGATWDQAQPWIQSFGQRLDRMVKDLNARFPKGLDMYVATIYDPSDGTGAMKHTGLPRWGDAVRILAAYNEQIQKLGQRHKNVHVIEVHRAFLGHGLHAQHWWETHYDPADPHCWLAANIEDPNDRGYDAIRRLMWNGVINTAPSAGF
jgi:hypothetical protein